MSSDRLLDHEAPEPAGHARSGWTRARGVLSRIGRRWDEFALSTRFVIVAAVTLASTMTVLGVWMDKQLRSGWIDSAADANALYIESFLEPHVQDLVGAPVLSEHTIAALDRLLRNFTLSQRVSLINIWRPDGFLLYSTDKTIVGRNYVKEEVRSALAGEVIFDADFTDDDQGMEDRGFAIPFMEIYTPLHKEGTREILAIGEFHEKTDFISDELTSIRYRILAAFATATGVVLLVIYIAVRRSGRIILAQRQALETTALQAVAMSRQNIRLRQEAEEARSAAGALNDKYLSRIGADLHDGPIQLLGLLMIKMHGVWQRLPPAKSRLRPRSDEEDDARDLRKISADIISELREISAGLVLPKLDELDLRGTILLASDRHQELTGTTVAHQFESLPADIPQDLKVCVYRVVQEALNNSFRHAEGRRQEISASASDGRIRIVLSDGGACRTSGEGDERRPRMGLLGMRSRVEALNGTFHLHRDGNGTRVFLELPVPPPRGEAGAIGYGSPVGS